VAFFFSSQRGIALTPLHYSRWPPNWEAYGNFGDEFRRGERGQNGAPATISNTMTTLDLTADEIAAIATAANVLPRDRRDDFREAVRAALAVVPERGPGIVHRVIVEAQRQYLDPPRVA
jgi:hypothetical protein